MSTLELAIEAMKFFAKIKDSMEGMSETGTVIASSSKAVLYVLNRGAKLVAYLMTRASKTREPVTPRRKKSKPIKVKPDVAVVVDINRRSLTDVAAYLDEKKIDADVIIITNDPRYESRSVFLAPAKRDDWEHMVREFSKVMDGIKHTVGGSRLHIFLSTPNALAFALGAVRGLVDEGTIVYHWEDRTYYPVVVLSRKLRQ
jgi:hypothetical protein